MFLNIVAVVGLVCLIWIGITFLPRACFIATLGYLVTKYEYLNFELLKNLRSELKIIFIAVLLAAAGTDVFFLEYFKQRRRFPSPRKKYNDKQ